MSSEPPNPGFECTLVFRCDYCDEPLDAFLENDCFWSDEYHTCFGEEPSLLALIDTDGSINVSDDSYRLDMEFGDN